MRTTYRPLCTVAQRHGYFHDERTAALRLLPTPQTQQNLRRAGLLLKAMPNGLVVLREMDTPAAARPLPAFLFPLRIQLQPFSPQFESFTEVPADYRADAFCYFSPSMAAENADAEPVALTMDDAVLVALRPFAFDFTPATTDPVSLVAMPTERELPAPVRATEAGQLSVDVRVAGAGRYQLRQAGQVLLDFYADDQLYAARAWGVLELGTDVLDAAATVELRFAARRTYWRYLIVCRQPAAEKYRKAPEQLRVSASPDASAQPRPAALSFRAETALPAGVHAAFVSDEPITLREQPVYQCKLLFQQPGSGSGPAPATVVTALPRAGADIVRPAPPGLPADAGYSDILIHL